MNETLKITHYLALSGPKDTKFSEDKHTSSTYVRNQKKKKKFNHFVKFHISEWSEGPFAI